MSAEGRLRRFFEGLYASLKRGGRAVLQFYPKNIVQRDMISKAAIRAGFGAGILEDDGGTKNVKTYLVLTVGGQGDITGVVKDMEGIDDEDGRRGAAAAAAAAGSSSFQDRRRLAGTDLKGSKAWVVRKREQMRNKGKIVRSNSKYTARKRRPKF